MMSQPFYCLCMHCSHRKVSDKQCQRTSTVIKRIMHCGTTRRSLHNMRPRGAYCVPCIHNNDKGSAVVWWLMPRTSDPEVRGSSPTRVKPCCVLEQGTVTPQKYW